jgi:hypothetical protein
MDDHHFGLQTKILKEILKTMLRCVVGKFALAKEIDEKQIGGANRGFH